MSPKNNTQQQQSTKQANVGNKQKVSNNQLPHRYEQRRTTDEQICAIEHEIELRRRISRIVNFNELYCETPPCGRLEDIPSEVTSIRSFDTESKKSFYADEREKDDEQSTELRLMIALILLGCLYLAVVDSASPNCDLGASDLIFVVQSSYDMSKKDFEDVKGFMKQYVDDLDIGPGSKSTRVGVVVFDRIREPYYRIKLAQATKLSHLQKAISTLRKIPCGYWWCQMQVDRTALEATQFALNIFNENASSDRMTKLLVILYGKEAFKDAEDIASSGTNNPSLRIAQIHVIPGWFNDVVDT
ncbi:unnamed protein product [Anisakis simplex]|uniref:VWFA domain-containing protein n=1 Tax=Anisakis simplex TaxID=6269 RepID=A0A0M3K6I6_ANISI|nr:unnamed protein product [Anisakis simplex]